MQHIQIAEISAIVAGNPTLANVKLRERWNGSDPEKGSAIVHDSTGELIAYVGGDEATHVAVSEIVNHHNASISSESSGQRTVHTANSIPLMKVASSQIAAIGHDAASQTLAIQFFHKGAPGNVYHYGNFTAEEYTAFAGAESIGRHFKQHIKPHAEKHPYQNMGVPTPAPAAEAAADQPQEQAA